jgi:hypothetical protein
MRRPAGCNSDDAAMARVGVPTRSGALCAAPSPGAAAEPVAALAMAGRTQDRCRGECRVMGTDDTADHRGRQVRSSTVTRRGILKRDGTGGGRRLIPSWRWRWRWPGAGAGQGGSHGMLRRSPCSEPPHPPYGARGRDSLCLSPATRSDFSRLQFAPGRTPSNIRGRKTAPYGWIDGYLRRICNRGVNGE